MIGSALIITSILLDPPAPASPGSPAPSVIRPVVRVSPFVTNESPRLLDSLRIARGDGTLAKRFAQLAKTELIILDDFGLKPLIQAELHDLLELIEDRHAVRATLITSQLPMAHWHEYLGEPTVADALLDRLLHNAYKLELKGESMRKSKSALTG